MQQVASRTAVAERLFEPRIAWQGQTAAEPRQAQAFADGHTILDSFNTSCAGASHQSGQVAKRKRYKGRHVCKAD